ncbi:MAG: hypothetical protein A2Y65_02360 [Deltaproteobacteria bacterium RBG_13_52_11]|nr:MAG: hypothetical protein A2Y65_02360 [Deltaproteobacteria bacterium RBG_13_52_11]
MLAKFARPILSGVFSRERLFQLVDKLREKPVLWASGSAGCGKTTLFNSYLDSRNLPCLWYQLDDRDADPAAFFYYLSLAVQQIDYIQKRPLPLLTAEYLPGLNAFTLGYFEEMFSRLKRPGVLVFDNYQDVPEPSLFHEVLRDGLSRIPPGINVILVSRGEPPAPFARMRANNEIGVMGWTDLRMTLEESEGLIHLASEIILSKEIAEGFHRFTDGWAAGLVLLLNRMRTSEIDLAALEHIPSEEIFDYFASEIFDKTDPRNRTFLCKTAFLPYMTARMAEKLTGIPEADHVFSLLSRMNYFTEKRLTPSISYQYHPLFRQFLLARARELFAPADLKEIVHKAADLLEKDGKIDDAFSLLSELNDVPHMTRLILSQASSMVSQGRHQTLGAWLKELPDEEIGRNAWLIYWLGCALTPFEPLQGQHYFEKAFYRFRGQEDQSGALLAWSGVVDTHLYLTGTFSSLDQWIDMLHELMERHPGFPSPQIEARVSSSMITALEFRQPDHPHFEMWAQRCLSLAHQSDDMAVKLQTYLPLAFCRLDQGAFHDVDQLIKTFGPLTRSAEIPPLPRILQRLLEAYYFWRAERFDESRQSAAEGVKLAETFGIPIFRFLLKGHSAAASLSEGRMPAAESMLAQMAADLESARPWDKALYYLMETWAELHREDFSKAAFHMETSWKLALEAGEAQSLTYCTLAQAIVALEMGHPKKCADYIEKVKDQRPMNSGAFVRFSCRIVEARLALDQGDEPTAEERLAEAMALGKNHGYCNLFLWQPKVMARLCAKALEAGIETDYVRELIRKRDLTPPATSGIPESWPWPVKVYTAGTFEILIEDEPLHFSGKVQKRPLALLKALIAFGGRKVGEHQICDELWPESEGDAAHSAFTSTLNRLRKLLKVEGAIETKGGLVSLNECICRVDVWSLERLLDEALELWEKGPPERAAMLTQKACAANRGPFLPDEQDLPCAGPIRERLKTKMLKGIKALGRHYESAGQWEEALSCYAEGLTSDPCAEALYERRMICFQHLGQTTEALKEYQQCCTALSTFMDARPSENIQALFRSLKGDPPPQA